MNLRVRILALLVLCVLVEAVATERPTGRSRYDFDAWAGPIINVRLFVPKNVTAQTPIVIVMHGWSRDAKRYFNDWYKLGRKHDFVVAVPLFPDDEFPTSNDYNSGHVFDAETGEMRPAEKWTFAAVEALFDDVVARIGSERQSYTLYGHSAGSQFVHRFLYYMPDARASRFVAANAGWYTLPDFNVDYPYGLKDAHISEEQLKAVLEKDVVIMLGREDVDRTDTSLRKTPEADRQGRNRLIRGLFMYKKAQSVARQLKADFSWRLETVDGAAHSNASMAKAAVKYVE